RTMTLEATQRFRDLSLRFDTIIWLPAAIANGTASDDIVDFADAHAADLEVSDPVVENWEILRNHREAGRSFDTAKFLTDVEASNESS
ncbi:hypothetical protein ABTE74_19975, partial [Acinetobacter baumannii]